MAIDPDMPVFPTVISDLIYTRLATIDPSGIQMWKRPILPQDAAASPSIGVFARQAVPQEDSREFFGKVPTIERYYVTIHSFVLDVDIEAGLRLSSVLAKTIYSMLYTDQPLGVGFQSSTSTVGGMLERFKRYGVRQISYVNNQIGNDYFFLATTEFWFETETTAM